MYTSLIKISYRSAGPLAGCRSACLASPHPTCRIMRISLSAPRPVEVGPPLIAGIFHAACIIHREVSFMRVVFRHWPVLPGMTAPAAENFPRISRGTMKRGRAAARNTSGVTRCEKELGVKLPLPGFTARQVSVGELPMIGPDLWWCIDELGLNPLPCDFSRGDERWNCSFVSRLRKMEDKSAFARSRRLRIRN